MKNSFGVFFWILRVESTQGNIKKLYISKHYYTLTENNMSFLSGCNCFFLGDASDAVPDRPKRSTVPKEF